MNTLTLPTFDAWLAKARELRDTQDYGDTNELVSEAFEILTGGDAFSTAAPGEQAVHAPEIEGGSAQRQCKISVWMEHDESDRPTPVCVALCQPCAKKLIEPHPRLYREMHEFEPRPGAMLTCVGCKWREGMWCKNPVAMINGGPGLSMTYPKPSMVHVDGQDKSGRRVGRTIAIYYAPAQCGNKESVGRR